MRRVTIKHVAERAGVSTATVSRTLHDHPRISDQTKKRVFEAVEELNYKSPLYARPASLKTIGLILPNSSDDLLLHPFFAQLLRGISSYAQAHGYFTLYGFSRQEDEKLDILRQYTRSDMVRGLILLAVNQHDPCIEFLSRENVPFALVGRPETPGRLLWVDNDNFHAMYDVVNHLVQGGARNIAFIGGPLEMNVTRDRLEGYRMGLVNRGVSHNEELVAFAESFTAPAGQRALDRILDSARPDAVVTTDDFLSLGARKALTERGWAGIPCVGFNNTPIVLDQVPELASVEIYPDRLGREAARLLLDVLENGAARDNHVIVPTKYVEQNRKE